MCARGTPGHRRRVSCLRVLRTSGRNSGSRSRSAAARWPWGQRLQAMWVRQARAQRTYLSASHDDDLRSIAAVEEVATAGLLHSPVGDGVDAFVADGAGFEDRARVA